MNLETCSFSLLLLVSQAAVAQQPLSLRQSIAEALTHNLDVKVAEYRPGLTDESIREARSGLLPQVSASAQYQYYLKVPVQLIPATLFAEPGAATSGPKYVAGSFTLPQTTTGTATLTQTLFDPAAFIGLKAAKVARNLDGLEIRATKEDVVYNVSATYYNLQALARNVELLQGNLASNTRVLNATASLVRNGLAAKTDYNRLLVNQKNTEADLQNAQLSYKKSLDMLKYLLGRPLTDPLAIEPAEAAEALPAQASYDPSQGTNRTSLLQIQENKYVKGLEKQRIQAGNMPTLSFTGAYSASGYNDQFNAFQNINGQWFGNSYVGLKLSVPVFDGLNRRAQTAYARVELERYDTQLAQARQKIAVDIANAVDSYNSNLNTLHSQEDNVKLAERVYRDEQVQYRNGLVKLTEVLTAEDDLRKAQNNYLTALLNVRTADLNLAQAKGELLN